MKGVGPPPMLRCLEGEPHARAPGVVGCKLTLSTIHPT